jgi:hypothetical protein
MLFRKREKKFPPEGDEILTVSSNELRFYSCAFSNEDREGGICFLQFLVAAHDEISAKKIRQYLAMTVLDTRAGAD